MRTLFVLLFGVLLVGCASTPTDPPPIPDPPPPANDFHARVLQAQKDWESYLRSGGASKADAEAVQDVRDAYDEAGTNYIDLVYELMVPSLLKRK